ncbi:uncharacterized protein FIBRA_05253 [Fibroporia radiculosa]|uniref:RFX-type winged-helix domain-containing protein n=1 Tax=Fibroporia radiculosa TaxID=599839 RepID=J4HX75_9APHY|nr:uncharacterized protein FIBRA_05253 [Fibroporia radiculosa]CCM03132.1 predicted protein [Fibroporia radiculosa]
MTTAHVASIVPRAASTVPYRASTYTPQATQPRPNVTDDYERWYTEATPNNRMLLSLRSGIDSEVAWALDRLCRLCNNEQFLLRAIPGLTDALFEWPFWYVRVGAKHCAPTSMLFSLPPEWERHRRHALESVFILRNAAVNEPNALELSQYESTRQLILLALHHIPTDSDSNMEFVQYVIELLQALAPNLVLPPPNAPVLANPLQPLQNLAGHASNRALILTSFTTLNLLLSNPANTGHLTEDSPALDAAVRYLPLFQDKALVDASVNYLYTHLAHPPMTKAFLLHSRMPATLKLLVSHLLSEQVEETVSLDIAAPIHTAPALTASIKNHELTKEEFDRLVPMPEPQRCYEWMKAMFVANPDGELTQVDFWNLYKDAFMPYQERYNLLVASDVIKNVNLVFPQAQAMVLPGPPQRFVVRGVDRRKDKSTIELYKCCWDRSQCPVEPFGSAGELYEHVLNQHVNPSEVAEVPCLWASCSHAPVPKAHVRGHVLTHLPNTQPTFPDPLQPTAITLSSENYPHPIPNPTTRPVPPAHSAKITYKRPVADPPSSALTALLCIRVLFRASFASSDAAPRADEDHFGFPGIVEDIGDQENSMQRAGTDREREGERRGRKAFIGARHLMENGFTPEQIAPNQDATKFWSGLFELDVDVVFLSGKVSEISKEDCLGTLKPILNAVILQCLYYARSMPVDDARKPHAVQTLSILSRCILRRNLAGWEIMEIFAGGVQNSDKVFNDLTAMIEDIWSDASAPVDLRHQVLQLAIIFVSGVSQLSPGAYFLRRDLFPSIVTLITSPETEKFTFEASLLVSLLANFHKSDAAKLNPYLHRIREAENDALMRKICWASNFAADAVVKSYQNISDDSPQTLGTAFGSLLSSLRPDRALSAKPIDTPRELFKHQPIEACVVLLPIFEFLSANTKFRAAFLEPLNPDSEKQVQPLPYTLLTLSSYLFTHASSTHAPRAIAYANLALNLLLVLAEAPDILNVFSHTNGATVRLCRQRPPLLPSSPSSPVCAILDCCVLWLRHNLHKRLEAYCYLKCTRVCYRVLFYLQKERLRLEYHWQDMWTALIGLLDFLSNKLDDLITTGGVEPIVRETLLILDLALCHSGEFLPTPQAVYGLVYEVVRSAPVFRKQKVLLDKLALPQAKSRFSDEGHAVEALANILAVTEHYEAKIQETTATSANQALRIVAGTIEHDGLVYGKDLHTEELP